MDISVTIYPTKISKILLNSIISMIKHKYPTIFSSLSQILCSM